MFQLIYIVLLVVFALTNAKPQGNGFNSAGGYNFKTYKKRIKIICPPGGRGSQGISNTYLPPQSQSPSYNAPRSGRLPTYPVPPPRPVNNFQSNTIPIGLSNQNNNQNRPSSSSSSLPVSPFPASNNGGSNLPVSPFPASTGGNNNRLPVSPFPASNGGSNNLPVSPFPASNNGGQAPYPPSNSYGPPFNSNFGGPKPVYGPPQISNDLFDELPPKSMNGRIMGRGSYTFIGKDGITRAIDGEMMFQATSRRTRKLGIPSAAVASLAGGGLG